MRWLRETFWRVVDWTRQAYTWSMGDYRFRPNDAHNPLLAAAIPAVAGLLATWFGSHSAGNRQKQQQQYEEQQRRQAYDASLRSPEHAASKFRASQAFGRFLAHYGGRANAPPTLLKYLEEMTKDQPYTPGARAPIAGTDWAPAIIGAGAQFATNYADAKGAQDQRNAGAAAWDLENKDKGWEDINNYDWSKTLVPNQSGGGGN